MGKRMTYPYTDERGVLHMSRHVEVHFDVEDIRADLETCEWATDSEYGDGREIRRCYLGSWLSLSPSGKIYAPFACSNVDECPVCHGTGDLRNPRKARLRKKYRNKAAKLRGWLLRYHGFFLDGKWHDHLVARLKRWDELGRDELTCPRCEGLGSAEAHDDELFTEGLDLFVKNEPDLYIEQDSGDIFVTQYRERQDEE